MPGFDRCCGGPQCLPGNMLPEMIGGVQCTILHGASYCCRTCVYGECTWGIVASSLRVRGIAQVAGTKYATKNNELGAHVAGKHFPSFHK